MHKLLLKLHVKTSRSLSKVSRNIPLLSSFPSGCWILKVPISSYSFILFETLSSCTKYAWCSGLVPVSFQTLQYLTPTIKSNDRDKFYLVVSQNRSRLTRKDMLFWCYSCRTMDMLCKQLVSFHQVLGNFCSIIKLFA